MRAIVVLAAGAGKRMCRDLPKVLHSLAGKSLLHRVLDTAKSIENVQKIIVVYGHQGEIVKNSVDFHKDLVWVEQKQQLGTGHAVQQVLHHIKDFSQVLVLSGDVPLLQRETIMQLLNNTKNGLGLLTFFPPDNFGLGRIVRDKNKSIKKIVEEKDSKASERSIKEVNAGVYVFPGNWLVDTLPCLDNNNKQKEYYLTDLIKVAVEQQLLISSIEPNYIWEVLGVNTLEQLTQLERAQQDFQARKFMLEGLQIADSMRFDLRGELSFGKNCFIDINVILEGKVKIGNNVQIGANCIIKDSIIEDNSIIEPFSHIVDTKIGSYVSVGPFARIRPGTVLNSRSKVGNFVEVKNSDIGSDTKINHLSYIGDASIGQKVNVGAGTITCNYDGSKKHRTVIADNVNIGSDTQLIAPVKIAANVTIAAGTTVMHDVTNAGLTLNPKQQVTKEDWVLSEKN